MNAVRRRIADPELAWMLANRFPNTLDTTVQIGRGDFETYVITGDIDAMWLRDSAAQVHPYLALCSQDDALSEVIASLIRTHAQCILRDPYAHAFYDDSARISEWKDDVTEMRPGVQEQLAVMRRGRIERGVSGLVGVGQHGR